jgi:hypothetical protein
MAKMATGYGDVAVSTGSSTPQRPWLTTPPAVGYGPTVTGSVPFAPSL